MPVTGRRVELAPDVRSRPENVRANIIRTTSFPRAATRAAFESDPMHRCIEQELYPAAVDGVIWIDARPGVPAP